MRTLAYVQYPSWINPEIIPGLPIRWYGFMYLVAFTIAFFLYKKQADDMKLGKTTDDIAGLFTWGIIGLLLGARIFSTLIYDTTGQYWTHPWLIFWPFDKDFQFTGLQGMSFHGGLVGTTLGVLLYSKRHKESFWQNTDMLVTAIPFGYFFGRLGNFINGELYGRVTDSAIGMVFPYAERFPIKEQWVSDIVAKLDIPVSTSGLANLPRYPSQLFEALFEGILLGIIMWMIFKKTLSLKPGTRTGIYLAGYGAIRFFIEYFREPDADLGFILKLSGQDNPIYLLNSPLDLSMGQLLCTLMILTGVLIILLMNRKSKT